MAKKPAEEAKVEVEKEVPVGPAKPAPVAKGGLSAHDLEEVIIDCTHEVKINGVPYFGKCKVPRHQAESMAEMIQKKQQADIAVFTGKSYIQRFLPNGDRIISPVIKKEGEE